jgi:hypothetical protein
VEKEDSGGLMPTPASSMMYASSRGCTSAAHALDARLRITCMHSRFVFCSLYRRLSRSPAALCLAAGFLNGESKFATWRC